MNLKKNKIIVLFISLITIIPSKLSCQDNQWENLLEDNTLKNFVILNGNAEFKVVDGNLIGTSKLNTPNSFLATKKTYRDFILEFEAE